METRQIIGITDPNSISFRLAFEQLLASCDLRVEVGGAVHRFGTCRVPVRAYDTLAVRPSFDALVNRGSIWNLQLRSFTMMIAHKVYLLNDPSTFVAVDKNVSFGQMHELGMRIPPTWALPQFDNAEVHAATSNVPEVVFADYEPFDLRAIGEQIGYPAYLKPQDGGGNDGVRRVESHEELVAAYHASGAEPMNLQKAVDHREFVRIVGVGPQITPMHFDPATPHSHDRYMRSATRAIDFDFLTPAERDEVTKTTKIINAFYGWDHNTCEALFPREGGSPYLIDFANAFPDCKLVSLHFHFPELVKAMIRWLVFVSVTGRRRPVSAVVRWPEYFAAAERARRDGLSWPETLDRLATIADSHFGTADFQEFVAAHLAGFEERAHRWFASEAFDRILVQEVTSRFRIEREHPAKLAHYRGIHRFWLECDRERLGLPRGE